MDQPVMSPAQQHEVRQRGRTTVGPVAGVVARAEPTPTIIGYMDSMMGIFLRGGFSVDVMHHAMHVMGSRILGFSQELFDDTASVPADEALAM
jgi:hypothetical protein